MAHDLTAQAHDVVLGRTSALSCLDRCLSIDPPHVFVRRFSASARATAQAVDALHAAGAPLPRLAGLAVSVKDLFDVAGEPTTAASASMHDVARAAHDAPAVARLRAAGAALVGHTNLSEFAFSGVGINPHHGTPANPAFAIGGAAHIPGGSTSGGAVSVATGAAWAALGSDTGGSIRIPAALQGLVGFKNTARLTPTDGAIPLSTTLDTACAITRSVRDAVLLHEILAQRRVRLRGRPVAGSRFGVPETVFTDALEPAVAAAFDAALAKLARAGARIERIPFAQVNEIASINARGTLSAAESWTWHRSRLAERGSMYDPRVARRIRGGEAMSAADYIDLQRARSGWIGRVAEAIAPFDAMLSPTVPMVAPLIEPLLASDDAFFAANNALLRNPSVVNFLDGCAVSLPCHAPATTPVGLMVWGAALADDAVLDASLAIEATLAEGFALTMRIAVIGAGIVGVTTAYELATDGHEVSVIDRSDAVATGTSFANAGVVAPGYVTPWASPGMTRKVIGQALSPHAALRIRPTLSLATWSWLARFWWAGGKRRYRANRSRMQRLAFYSRGRLHALTAQLGLGYERADGYLVLLRQEKELAMARPGLDLLADTGTRFEVVDAARCLALEPGLNADTPLHAGIHLPDDEVGNCRQFATLMRSQAQTLGATFRLGTEVVAIEPGAPPALMLRSVGGVARRESFDAVVVCAGVESRALLRAVGVALPILAVHGYSITAPLRLDPQHPDRGPRSGLMDERFKVAITRLGQRVRVAGSAEIGWGPSHMSERSLGTLYKVLNDWFPGAAQMNQSQVWKGARPMLPGGPPRIGESGAAGIWMNVGHGSSGWALACGSARLVADRIAGRDPEFDAEGLAPGSRP